MHYHRLTDHTGQRAHPQRDALSWCKQHPILTITHYHLQTDHHRGTDHRPHTPLHTPLQDREHTHRGMHSHGISTDRPTTTEELTTDYTQTDHTPLQDREHTHRGMLSHGISTYTPTIEELTTTGQSTHHRGMLSHSASSIQY